jgi:hypothetical protein
MPTRRFTPGGFLLAVQRASKLSSLAPGMGISMPLISGWVRGYNADRMVFEFVMLNDKAETVECSISSVAMDDLAGARGSFPEERERQFLQLREAIEPIASGIFDKEERKTGVVIRIFSKHVRGAYRVLEK